MSQDAFDAVQVASQLGRLDFLSAAVAVLAAVVGFAAFPFWFFAQRKAERVARDAADEVLSGAVDRVEQAAISKLEALLPMLMEEYRILAANAVDADTANAIAGTQDDGGALPSRGGKDVTR